MTGSTCGRDAANASLQRLFRSRDPYFEIEPLATLGDRLLLTRRCTGAGGDTRGRYDVGPYENEALEIHEVDEHGLICRQEVFATDHLADACVRLYERYAERLPDGPERTRAAAVAHSLASLQRDPEFLAPALAPDFEGVDHRHLHLWSLRGAAAYVEHLRALHQVSDDVVYRERDILALEPRAMLLHTVRTGTARVGGGAHELLFFAIFVTNAEGRLARAEWFDEGRKAEALARFDALTAEPALPRPARRVRANAASAAMARFEAAFAARDVAALEASFEESLTVVDHPNGASYERAGEITSVRQLLRARETQWRATSLATLGDSLSLDRRSISARGTGGGRFDVAKHEADHLTVSEVDGRGRFQRIETFATGHLGDAIVRLYERWAGSMPDGPERTRATATARSLAVLAETFELDRFAAAIAPAIEVVDHRTVGFGSLHGAEALVQAVRAMVELTEGLDWRIDDVFALRADALLVRNIRSGIQRAGGGAFEIALRELWLFGANGRITRFERFEADREAEALARFDALAGSGAAAHAELFEHAVASGGGDLPRGIIEYSRAVNEHDLVRARTGLCDDFVLDDHRRTGMGHIEGADAYIASVAALYALSPDVRVDSLYTAAAAKHGGVFLVRVAGTNTEGGAFESFYVTLHRFRDEKVAGIEFFEPEHLDEALARFEALGRT